MNREKRRIQLIKSSYPQGTRVECLEMNDPYRPVPQGTRGTVIAVDDMGTVHVSWDNGSSLGLVSEEDRFRKLSPEEIEEENSVQTNNEMKM